MDPKLIIEEENGFRQIFEFVVDENGNPIKLGDGSFGVVYKIRSKEEDYAIKLFYEDTGQYSLDALEINEQVLESFRASNSIKLSNSKYQNLKKLTGEKYTLASLFDSLKNLNLSSYELEVLFKEILRVSGTDSTVRERYKYERDASSDVMNILRNFEDSAIDTNLYKGVIKIITGTDTFKSSDAYKSFKEKFEEDKINISNFGIVMYLYEYTLKELLERKTDNFLINVNSVSLQELQISKDIPNVAIQLVNRVYKTEEELIKIISNNQHLKKHNLELRKHIYNLNGYDLLNSMSYINRISTILPYLLYICQGLRALHLADKFHYDLKPANIFVRGGNMVEAAIGDLGFFIVPTLQKEDKLRKSAQNILPLGTRHFRSPEQKDYFDVCDVKIDEHGDLIIRDPKFIDTIIEEGDYAVFSKDAKYLKHYIKEKKIDKNDSLPIKIILEKNENQKLKEDHKTQALFYKNQDSRTDIFGFGALVFDMLTGGKSPERFYDKIRSFDTKDSTVSELISKYRKVKGYQITEPKLLLLFSDFKDIENKVFAPEEMVELIFKCMMYRPNDTYYNQHKNQCELISKEHTNSIKAPLEHIFDHLIVLKRKYPYLDYGNHLLNKTLPKFGHNGPSTHLGDKISILQKLDYDKLHIRLFEGVFFLKKLVKLVRSMDLKNIEKPQYFCQLLPNNVILTDRDTKLDFFFIAYESKARYIEDLKNDSVYQNVTRDIANPFVPNYLTFLRRKIEVTPLPSNKNKYKFLFLESALLGGNIEEGDWILIYDNLCKVINVEGNEIELKSISNTKIITKREGAKKTDKNVAHLFYKNLDPYFYYLYMMGIYLHQIFFVGLGSATKDKPILITIAQSARFLSNIKNPVKITSQEASINKSNPKLKDIFNFLSYMYLKLAFPFHESSYFASEKLDKERIMALDNDVNDLQKLIEKVYGLRDTALDDSLNITEESRYETVMKDEKIENFDFDYLMRKNIDLTVNKPSNGIIEYSEIINKAGDLKDDLFERIKKMASFFTN